MLYTNAKHVPGTFTVENYHSEKGLAEKRVVVREGICFRALDDDYNTFFMFVCVCVCIYVWVCVFGNYVTNWFSIKQIENKSQFHSATWNFFPLLFFALYSVGWYFIPFVDGFDALHVYKDTNGLVQTIIGQWSLLTIAL